MCRFGTAKPTYHRAARRGSRRPSGVAACPPVGLVTTSDDSDAVSLTARVEHVQLRPWPRNVALFQPNPTRRISAKSITLHPTPSALRCCCRHVTWNGVMNWHINYLFLAYGGQKEISTDRSCGLIYATWPRTDPRNRCKLWQGSRCRAFPSRML